jgi:hypothetical protein
LKEKSTHEAVSIMVGLVWYGFERKSQSGLFPYGRQSGEKKIVERSIRLLLAIEIDHS